jgi:hypothetical protein
MSTMKRFGPAARCRSVSAFCCRMKSARTNCESAWSEWHAVLAAALLTGSRFARASAARADRGGTGRGMTAISDPCASAVWFPRQKGGFFPSDVGATGIILSDIPRAVAARSCRRRSDSKRTARVSRRAADCGRCGAGGAAAISSAAASGLVPPALLSDEPAPLPPPPPGGAAGDIGRGVEDVRFDGVGRCAAGCSASGGAAADVRPFLIKSSGDKPPARPEDVGD